MGDAPTSERLCQSNDLHGKQEAIRGDRRGRRQQIRQEFFRLAGCFFLALSLKAAIQFDHKQHALLKMKCVSCHEIGERASFPDVSKCQSCHPEFKLSGRIVPEKPVCVLPDFVFFSHARHSADCEACHKTFVAMKMKTCVDCHKANRAAVACTVCHDLSP